MIGERDDSVVEEAGKSVYYSVYPTTDPIGPGLVGEVDNSLGRCPDIKSHEVLTDDDPGTAPLVGGSHHGRELRKLPCNPAIAIELVGTQSQNNYYSGG